MMLLIQTSQTVAFNAGGIALGILGIIVLALVFVGIYVMVRIVNKQLPKPEKSSLLKQIAENKEGIKALSSQMAVAPDKQ